MREDQHAGDTEHEEVKMLGSSANNDAHCYLAGGDWRVSRWGFHVLSC